MDLGMFEYGGFGSYQGTVELGAVTLKTQCTLKGASEYGYVTDGSITLKDLLAEAQLRAAHDDSIYKVFKEVHRKGMQALLQANLPLVVGVGLNGAGG